MTVTIYRRVETGDCVITESASAPVPDQLILDIEDECRAAFSMSSMLFDSLPMVRELRRALHPHPPAANSKS